MRSTASRSGHASGRRRRPADPSPPVTVPAQASYATTSGPVTTSAAPAVIDAVPGTGPAASGLAGRAGAGAGAGARLAALLAYLGAAVLSFLPPLLISLLSSRNSAFLREHTVQALNAALTTALYAASAAIVGALLALDSPQLGLRFAVTCAMFCWLVTSGYLAAAAVAACRGRFYRIPAWLCAQLLQP